MDHLKAAKNRLPAHALEGMAEYFEHMASQFRTAAKSRKERDERLIRASARYAAVRTTADLIAIWSRADRRRKPSS